MMMILLNVRPHDMMLVKSISETRFEFFIEEKGSLPSFLLATVDTRKTSGSDLCLNG